MNAPLIVCIHLKIVTSAIHHAVMYIQMAVALSRIMIQNIARSLQEAFMNKKASTGGQRPHNPKT